MLHFEKLLLINFSGVVPLFCENVFKGIDAKKAEGDTTEFEVYNCQ